MAGSTKESQAAGGSVLGQGVLLGGRGGEVWERGWMWGKENEKTWDGVTAPRIMILLEGLQMCLRFPLGRACLCSLSEEWKFGNPGQVG